MNFEVNNIPHSADEYDVTRAIMAVLHSEDFYNPEDGNNSRPMNFQLTLNESKIRGYIHDTRGTLTLPARDIGQRFLRWTKAEDNVIRVNGRRLKIYPAQDAPERRLQETLKKVPFVDPEKRRDLEKKNNSLNESIRILRLQFGIFYIPPGQSGRAFSVEYDRDTTGDVAWLWVHYNHKCIRIKIGDPVSSDTLHTIAIKFTSINKIGVGSDTGAPFICFDLHTPTILEKEAFYRTMTGDEYKDNQKFKRRLIALDPAHGQVAPYAHHLRLELVNHHDIPLFASLCAIAGLKAPVKAALVASQRQMFSAKQLMNIRRWVAARDWSTAWQIELLLHNQLVNTEELLNDLYVPINQLYDRDREKCAQFLRNFVEALQNPLRPRGESALACFHRVRSEKLAKAPMEIPPGMFPCHHITFTPTRLILEGPYANQSNRVIRRYPGFQDHFIRVDFRDEDRLQYRWEREVDGGPFLQDRVGRILKNGFEIAGRYFEFLAYSSSALREHSVWFVHPFKNTGNQYHDRSVVMINAAEIRRTLGDFEGVIKQPAKYAARMAQAFTATDPSVIIARADWEEIPDLGNEPYQFTDGVGTISPDLGNRIWDALCRDRPGLLQRNIKPSAYQIRFLGYKGMVGIDWELKGIKMRLRPSMNKFRAHEADFAEIEIARAFDKPMTCMTNRSLIMILEDRGVPKNVFLDMQNVAKADVILAEREIDRFRAMLRDQHLGGSYYLAYITDKLQQLGFEMEESSEEAARIDLPFFNRLVKFATHHVLRDMKHGARIQVKKGWLLPGIADEGPAYEAAGFTNVFKLKGNHIFACVQGPDDPEPHWLKGSCIIWRSPAVHPGDVQRVFAMGRPPPDDLLCPFRHSKNVVVLPSVGERSLASMLGGGDVDGDLFYISQEPGLLPSEHIQPASYDPAQPILLDRPAKIEDVCDFVVNYIYSDVLGLLSSRHLIIADQSVEGTLDKRCIELARLCGLAVDFPKSGVPVDIKKSPRLLIPFKPDWNSAEVVNPDHDEFYESSRALGHLYRDISLPELPELPPPTIARTVPIHDQVSWAVLEEIQRFLPNLMPTEEEPEWLTNLFQGYLNELGFIRCTHTLSHIAGSRLTEEEVVVGTILAACTQKRWRKDRIARLKLHSNALARGIERVLLPNVKQATEQELFTGLDRAWNAWCFSVRYQLYEAAPSFGLIALSLIFAILDQLALLS